MILNFSNLTPKQQIIKLLQLIEDDYNKTDQLASINGLLNLLNIKSYQEQELIFKRIAIHHSIEMDIFKDPTPTFGIEMVGRHLSSSEISYLIEIMNDNGIEREQRISNIEEIIDFTAISGDIAIFIPVKYFTKLDETKFGKYNNNLTATVKIGYRKFPIVYFKDEKVKNKIYILGKDAIKWMRKIDPILPPNVKHYNNITSEDDFFQKAYIILDDQIKYTASIVINSEIIDRSRIEIIKINE